MLTFARSTFVTAQLLVLISMGMVDGIGLSQIELREKYGQGNWKQ